MPNVTEIASLFSQQGPEMRSSVPAKPSVGRKWAPENGSASSNVRNPPNIAKKPPFGSTVNNSMNHDATPKPSFLHQAKNNSAVPACKPDLAQRNMGWLSAVDTKKPREKKQEESKPDNPWKKNLTTNEYNQSTNKHDKTIPSWKKAIADRAEQNPDPPWKKSADAANTNSEVNVHCAPWTKLKNDDSSEQENAKPVPAWKGLPVTDKPQLHVNRKNEVTSRWNKPTPEKSSDTKEENKQHPLSPKPPAIAKKPSSSLYPNPNASSEANRHSHNDPLSPRHNSPSRQGSVASTKSWKSDCNSENEFPSGGSFVGSRPLSRDPSAGLSSGTASTLQTGRSSFLHKSAAAAGDSMSSHVTSRRRRTLPSDITSRPPPPKPRKPLNVKLPGKDKLSPQRGQYNGHTDLPLPEAPSKPAKGLPPSPGSSSLASRSESFLSKFKEATSGECNDLPPPPPAVSIRNLPTPPGQRKQFTSSKDLPLPPPNDDLYTDTDDAHGPLLPPINNRPPAPHPLITRKSSGAIPTWDDEEAEDFYDQTPDSGPGGYPSSPAPGMPLPLPVAQDESEEFYEDLDDYQKFKAQKSEPQNVQTPEEDEKKKKETEKMRKKFKLPKEGAIPVQGSGFVKADSKGGGLFDKNQLTVHSNEKIDIIRMEDNPKGKWLARNTEGIYGYVDADNITMQIEDLRSMMHSGKNLGPTTALPLPSPNSAYNMADQEEQVYDETPEDLYEEL